MYFVIINRKTGVILTTTDTEAEAVAVIAQEVCRLKDTGQRDPGWMIEAR